MDTSFKLHEFVEVLAGPKAFWIGEVSGIIDAYVDGKEHRIYQVRFGTDDYVYVGPKELKHVG